MIRSLILILLTKGFLFGKITAEKNQKLWSVENDPASIDLLNPDGKAADAFDAGWNYHARVSEAPGTKATGQITESSDKISAVDGQRYFRISLKGGDAKRLSGKVSLSGIPVDLSMGRQFRLEYSTRVDSKHGPQAVNSALVFSTDKDAKSPTEVVTAKNQMIEHGKWQQHSSDFVCSSATSGSVLEIRLGFLRLLPDGRVVSADALLDGLRLYQIKGSPGAAVEMTEKEQNSPPPVAPIPIQFTVPQAGQVTLVMESADGTRINNLIEGVFYEKGTHTFLWDGLDLGEKVYGEGGHALYSLNRRIVAPGTYTIRGLVHDQLKLTYDFTAYPNIGEGNIPWPTHLHDGEGGWLADHGMPYAAAFIPAAESPHGEDVVALGAAVAEAGPAMAYVDMDGKKRGGFWRLGGNWTGATQFARDTGPNRHPDVFLYSVKAWSPPKGAPENSVLLKILAFTKGGNLEVDFLTLTLPVGAVWSDGEVGGFAVRDGLLVVSELLSESILIYDTSKVSDSQKGHLLKQLDFPGVGALAFASDDKLLVAQDKQIKSFTLDRETLALTGETILIKEGLEEPMQLTVTEDGRIFVADWGDSQQVKIHSAEGVLQQRIGTAGPVASGPYDPTHINHPFGMALDSRGRLWVTEVNRLPKRVSVWNLDDATLEQAFYGPTEYGGGGVLDPKDPDIIYYANAFGCMSFRLDRDKGEGIPERIVYRREDVAAAGGKVRYVCGRFPIYKGKHRYLTNDYSGPTTGARAIEFWLDTDGASARPVTIIGNLRGFQYYAAETTRLAPHFPVFTKKNPTGRLERIAQYQILDKTLACWTDTSNNGAIEPDEIQFLSFVDREDVDGILTASIGDDFEILIVHRKGVIRIPSSGFSAEGHPLYDLTKLEHPVTGLALRPSSGGNQAMRCEDGSLLITGGPMQAFRDGKQVWRIHSQWPSLHAGHAAPKQPQYPGQMLSTSRLLGPLIKPTSGDAGQIWGMNSDDGVMYLMTGDGLHLATIGEMGPESQRWTMPEAIRGMDVTGINHLPENFHPTLNQNPDGTLTLVSGKTHLSLIDIEGLESTRRFTAPDVVVDADVVEKAKAHGDALSEWQRANETDEWEILVSRRTATVDGDLSEWNDARWVTISKSTEQYGWGRPVETPEAQAAWAVDENNLYVAVRSRKSSCIENSGNDPGSFFQTGGGVDIRLATQNGAEREGRRSQPVEGDIRLLAGQHEGDITAFIYRAKVPGTQQPIRISSPVSELTIDRIDDVSAELAFATGRTKLPSTINAAKKIPYTMIELSIPLSVLGWNPEELPNTRADIGLLFDKDGRTVARSYWHNKSAGIVSDLPSEASLDVGQWGPLHLQKDKDEK